MDQGSEKREAQRAPMDARVSWSVDGETWYEDRSRDVSSTGMMLMTEVPVASGSVITMKFMLPNSGLRESIRSRAEVVRTVRRRERQVSIGLRFLSLHSRSSRAVHEFVCRIIGLPLQEGITGLGNRDDDGYSYNMEELVREAKAREEAAIDRRLAAAEKAEFRGKVRLWAGRAVKVALVLLAGFVVFKILFFFIDLLGGIRKG
jgi:hypothetical protein